jgi:hypothetical protein
MSDATTIEADVPERHADAVSERLRDHGLTTVRVVVGDIDEIKEQL